MVLTSSSCPWTIRKWSTEAAPFPAISPRSPSCASDMLTIVSVFPLASRQSHRSMIPFRMPIYAMFCAVFVSDGCAKLEAGSRDLTSSWRHSESTSLAVCNRRNESLSTSGKHTRPLRPPAGYSAVSYCYAQGLFRMTLFLPTIALRLQT